MSLITFTTSSTSKVTKKSSPTTKSANIEKTTQIYTKQKRPKPILPGRKRKFTKSVFFIPTKAYPNPAKQHYHHAHLLYQQHKEYVQLKYSAMAGAVWDKELKRWRPTKNQSIIATTSSPIDGPVEVKTNSAVCSKIFHKMVLTVQMYQNGLRRTKFPAIKESPIYNTLLQIVPKS